MKMGVVFTKNNARIVHDPKELRNIVRWTNVLIDPDLEAVKGVPPHYWKMDGKKVVVKNAAERAWVDQSHAKNGVDNEHLPVAHRGGIWLPPWIFPVFWVLLALLSYGLGRHG